MALGRRKREQQQQALLVATTSLPQSPGHPFYEKLNQLLGEAQFDEYVEGLCRPYYADGVGRPGIPPGVHFRMLFVGYFEGLDSQRVIVWRCGDSRSLQSFLGYPLTAPPPDHSSLTVIRQRLPLAIQERVFAKVLPVAQERKLLQGRTVAVDSTFLEAEVQEAVADKGYHSTENVTWCHSYGIRTYIPERASRHERRWTDKSPEEKAAVYGNRRRVRGKRGKLLRTCMRSTLPSRARKEAAGRRRDVRSFTVAARINGPLFIHVLSRLRSEYPERSFAHTCETGGARRSRLRGLIDVAKRYRMYAAGRNLGVIMRAIFGIGTPRSLQTEGEAPPGAGFSCFVWFARRLRRRWAECVRPFPWGMPAPVRVLRTA